MRTLKHSIRIDGHSDDQKPFELPLDLIRLPFLVPGVGGAVQVGEEGLE
jgi:hypothetical protein